MCFTWLNNGVGVKYGPSPFTYRIVSVQIIKHATSTYRVLGKPAVSASGARPQTADRRPLKASDSRHPINNDKSHPQTLIGVCPMAWWSRLWRAVPLADDLHK